MEDKDKESEILSRMMEDFNKRSDALVKAYQAMEVQFEKLNIELDEKNRKLEAALHEQSKTHAMMNSILETMHNGVISVDLHGEITQFNSAAEAITGYDRSEVMAKSLVDAFGDKELSDNNVIDTLRSGAGHEVDEKVLWSKDGAPVPVKYQSSLLNDHNGELLGAVEIFSDMSKLKALESENNQNKILAALGEMAATLAHEIKNPLGAMGTWARLLDRTLDDSNERGKNTLAKIIDALSRLNKIVSSMLIFGRQSNNTELRTINLKDLLEEFVDSMEIEVIYTSEKDIEVIKVWDDNPLPVAVEPEKIRQVLLNLMINATQAIEASGKITVSCREVSNSSGDYGLFTVEDTGPGIAREELEKIFTPFHTTKENGTGLGLAIVRKLIDFHSGVIDIKSEVGIGTTFEVFLPIAK